MMRTLFLTGLFLVLMVAPALAELPKEVLDREYQTCSGDGQDQQRNAYCECVRDEMRGWSEDDYMQLAQSASASQTNGAATPTKLTEVAKDCIAKTLH